MRILQCVTPGQLEYGETSIPEPSTGNAILRIKRIGICGTDLHAFEGTQPYFNYPRILGHELAAELIDADDAPGFIKGEIVTFVPYFNCGQCIACRTGKPNCCVQIKVCGVHIDGGMVEYLSVPSYSLVHGNGLPEDALALVEPLAIGAHAVRRSGIGPGEHVLVVGAGPIGLGIMEFARIQGATVIALDVNQGRLQFCADQKMCHYAINAADNVKELLSEISNRDMMDVVIDATGNLKAINNSFQYMAHGGRYVLVGLQKGDISFSHPEFHKREGMLLSSRNATHEDFAEVISRLKQKEINPMNYITHRVMFDEVKDSFNSWLDPKTGVIKAMVTIPD
jgi:2-desacetyl-2-hydroxyethyl bacteriochlorophyllide A dehydrogenase